MTRSRRKTARERKILTIQSLLEYTSEGYWVYLDDKKPIHPSWILSMPLKTVVSMIYEGRLRKCVSLDCFRNVGSCEGPRPYYYRS